VTVQFPKGLVLAILHKKLSWCWQTRTTRSVFSRRHQTNLGQKSLKVIGNVTIR